MGHWYALISILLFHLVNLRISSTTATRCTPDNCQLKESYDFIIVGGGTAGCVLANRLSENPKFSVLVVEAGGYPPDGSKIPLLAGALESEYEFTWNYRTTKQDNLCQIDGGRCLVPEAMLLGGTSSTWRMDYIRGLRKDFDQWESEGNPGWSWRYVLPYFQKAERFIGPAKYGTSMGRNGMWPITPSNSSWLSDYFMAALREVGLQETDLEEGCGSGFGLSLNTVDDGERVSTYNAYLEPALPRLNIDLMTQSMVTKIMVSNGTAVGVQFVYKNTKYQVAARKEVIVTCGAINSPKLLMLSGIGPADHLEDLAIQVVQDLPVGSICKDHPSVNAFFQINQVAPYTGKQMIDEIKAFIRSKTGILTEPVGHVITVLTNSSQSTYDLPDIHVYISIPGNRNFVFIGGYCTRPESQGTIRLRSSDPHDAPLIDINSLSTPQDVVCMRELAQLIFQVASTNSARTLGTTYSSLFTPACPYDANLQGCLIRQYGRTFNHISGTCKMGPKKDPYAVVDHELRVHNVQSLRVVDASVMPESPSGSTPAPVVMMAEKVADVIKRDYSDGCSYC